MEQCIYWFHNSNYLTMNILSSVPRETLSFIATILVAIITGIISPFVVKRIRGKSEENNANAEAVLFITNATVTLIDPLQKKIEYLEKRDYELHVEIESSKKELELHRKEIDNLKKLLAEAKNREADLVQDNVSLKTENEQLKRQLDEAKLELAQLRDRVAFLENRGKKR